MFKKILVALDGSEHSLHALEKAVQIAKKFDGKITLVHVYSIVHPFIVSPISMVEGGTLPPELVSRWVEEASKAGNNILAEGEKRVEAEGIQAEKLLREGHAVEEILKTCRDGRFDLVVVGARGLSRLEEILLGSVSHRVATHAQCPVLVVK